MKKGDTENFEAVQKDYYNTIAQEYELHYSSSDALKYRHSLYSGFLKNIDVKEMKILDAMCGGGQSTGFFIKRGANVTGIDISEGQCENFKKNFPGCEIHCRSILSPELGEKCFDFIITDSLHHVHPDIDRCMMVFNGLLKPGGYLMLWEPSAKSIFDYIRKVWYKRDKKYFQENEAAIDLKKLITDNNESFRLVKKSYGGNIAYIFVLLTMALRLKNNKKRVWFNVFLFFEKGLSRLQNRYTALWFLALFQKK
jgi:2-polyprenyl-3-methyl-5-hydroxy-6-metoxy-1,4-benzoquinol methylase